jgi:hypothetical protein
MAYVNPTVAEFKVYFNRDFPFGTNAETSVLNSDIEKAFGLTAVNFNPDLFCEQASYTIGYLLLSAHYLVMDLRASSQGLNGQFSFLEQSKSVGSISQSFAIPDRIMQNPEWAMLMKTNYGAQFMMLVLPQMAGQIYTVAGSTRP